jgi:ribonuclease HI
MDRADIVCGRSHTSYRGELRAVAHVILTAGRKAEIITDCKAVANQMRKMIYQHAMGEDIASPTTNKDIWEAIEAGITAGPANYFKVSWTKAHLEGEQAEQAIRDGKTTRQDVERNRAVDLLAKQGAEKHEMPDGVPELGGVQG